MVINALTNAVYEDVFYSMQDIKEAAVWMFVELMSVQILQRNGHPDWTWSRPILRDVKTVSGRTTQTTQPWYIKHIKQRRNPTPWMQQLTQSRYSTIRKWMFFGMVASMIATTLGWNSATLQPTLTLSPASVTAGKVHTDHHASV